MKHTVKQIAKVTLTLLLALLSALALVSCNTVDAEGLWENATYRRDKEFGKGEKTAVVEVAVADEMVTFTIHTDKDTVGAALAEHDLIAGEDSEFGLYVKTVNGITADYDIDQSYWAFYINGEMALTGVDSTPIVEGEIYRLAYKK